MKKNKYIGLTMMAAVMLAATSCSDFDDYNKVETDASASANQTLWQNIQGNPQLSEFRELVASTGFDSELDATHYYTVWAPKNGFDKSDYQGLSNDALLRRFVKNHIASYSHPASGTIDERILMLNEKSYDFAGTGSYSFNGVGVADANLPSSNGVLHILDGASAFYPNLYEFVTDEQQAAQYGLDSLRNFFRRYEQTYLDTERSVQGSIVDGMQTYVDSVMVTENTLWSTLNVKMNNEDSTYTFLMPTNRAWNATYNTVKSCYHYINSTVTHTFQETSGGFNATVSSPLTIDASYWADSIANRYVTRFLAYSNNNPYNKWLTSDPSYKGTDTLYTTTREKLSAPSEILAQTTATIKMSNGVARVVDSLAMHPWETYSPERVISATSRSTLAGVANGNAFTITVNNPDPTKVDMTEQTSSALSYLHVEKSGSSRPNVAILLPNVLSTTYDFYCVFVPENVDPEKSDVETKPNRVIFTLYYCDASGKMAEHIFLNDDEEAAAAFKEKYKLSNTNANNQAAHGFSNDTSKVDTVYIGEFTFPVCYYGLEEGYCPNIRVSSPFSAVTGTVRNDYERDLRIAAIILKPKELVEYEESNK